VQTVTERLKPEHGYYHTPTGPSSSHGSSQIRTDESSNGSNVLDFFSRKTFQTVLHTPTTAHQLRLYSQSRLCGENMEFLEMVTKHRALLDDVSRIMFAIHRDYISPKATKQINISEQLLLKTNKELKASLELTLPKLDSVYVDAQSDIERLVSSDVYPGFVRHQMSKSAAKALSGDPDKYAGLGDCFVLTDPHKADQPIVFASDGFVNVTGYARNEIIPRNCRFLQRPGVDKSAVQRLRDAIDKQQESTEILLNETKDKQPFWNLLYTTPLFDAHGDVVFFLGCQVNCSTTIHSQSDVLRILALPDDIGEKKDRNPSTIETNPKPPRNARVLSTFLSKRKASVPSTTSMETTALGKMEKMDTKSQKDAFRSAYSKVSLHTIVYHRTSSQFPVPCRRLQHLLRDFLFGRH